jgi:2-polyprenyl-6-methoxyphenol hydroxylase-like FAD-dependent oxidoreductase
MEANTDVLIVGAGPTGLMLASQLARRGVHVTIIDRHSGPAQQSRAMAVQTRTLEIYSKLGIAEEAIARGARGTGANLWSNGKWTARVPIGDIGEGLSPFPFVLMLGQDENERILGEKLTEFGVNVAWRTELVSFEQHPNLVDATLKLPDGSRGTIRAAWMAGCDGSRSTVREKSGIGFPGAPYEHTFFVADTEATGPMKPDEVNVYLSRDGFHLFFPMRRKDRWRVIGILPKKLRQRDDVTFEEVVPSIREEAGVDLNFTSCGWFSTYRIYHRAAERFRDRRCFLLGDAAHIHSPMGGQGMNTGLQDAYNLAWKLALVVTGEAKSALLDTYEQERIPVAQQLLRTTDRAFQLVVADNWFATLLRTRVIGKIAARAMTFDWVRKRAFKTLSQTGIAYPQSALSQNLGHAAMNAPKAGDRFPWLRLRMRPGGPIEDLFQKLDDTRFNLLVFEQPNAVGGISTAYGDQVSIHVIPADPVNDAELARANITAPLFYLLRPDGHVGLCGAQSELSAVGPYLSRWLAPHENAADEPQSRRLQPSLAQPEAR